MNKSRMPILPAGLCFAALVFAGPQRPQLVDPFPPRFPLAEAGTLEIEGTIVGQPRARDGIVYLTTREGSLMAVAVSARAIFWRFKADNALLTGPELGEGRIIIRDVDNTIYVLNSSGSLLLKKVLDGPVSTAVREGHGRLYFGTLTGWIKALDLAGAGTFAWEYRAAAAVKAGPAFIDERVLFAGQDGRLLALDSAGRLAWAFTAEGAVAADPAAAGNAVYFGTESRRFYCLDAATGKERWDRRLQGAPLHPAVVRGRRLAVAASNSAVYLLSGGGGAILAWEAVPSRIVHEPAAAGPHLLISSATGNVSLFDCVTGKRIGQHLTSSPLTAGALWISPFVLLFEESPEPGRQRIVFLRPR